MTKVAAAQSDHAADDGSSHADVASNNSHRAGDGSDHADVADNTTHVAQAVTGSTLPHGIPKCKFNATAAPGVTNDESEGYWEGSRWLKINATVGEWVCVDNTNGAAAWLQLG